jgi:hypothetical protein
LKDLSIQERSISTQEVLRKGILTLNSFREDQQCEVTTLGEDKNKNEKRILETDRETQITCNKARKLNKNKAKLEKHITKEWSKEFIVPVTDPELSDTDTIGIPIVT